MPCSMSDMDSGDHAMPKAREVERRVDELEQALCGLCQQLSATGDPSITRNLHPQLQQWFDNHRREPGCVA